MKKITILFLLVYLVESSVADSTPVEVNTANEIRREALLPPVSEIGNPLPLAANWNSGQFPNTFDPKYQLGLIAEGHHLLPWFQLDQPGQNSTNNIAHYYDVAMKKASELNLPISFLSTQWERLLSDENKYIKAATNENPNIVESNGEIEKMVSPMGSVGLWYQVGQSWTNTTLLKQLQVMYPAPSFVLFVSNNEHKKLNWFDANKDERFTAEYGSNLSELEVKEIFSERWITRYRALQQGMKDSLLKSEWKSNSKFIGYNAFGSSAMGRWPNWGKYTLNTEKYSSPWPLAWDGASPPFYTHDWDPSTDYNVWGPMISSMNWVFMKEEALSLNPNFWFEISIWDGNQPGRSTDKRKFYEATGQPYSPARYGGMVKYAMWLLRPRVMREFRNPNQTRDTTESYFMEIVKAVDEIYHNPVLEGFWRKGRLVRNNTTENPYNSNLEYKYLTQERWFLLNTNYDARKPWNVHTVIPVFAIALELSKPEGREWLLYCFSPLGDRSNVQVEIPDYKKVNVDSKVKGQFYYINEREDKVSQL